MSVSKAMLNLMTLGMAGQPQVNIPAPLVVTAPAPDTAGSLGGIDEAAKAAAAAQAELERKKKGRAATIMSGPEGVMTAAPVQRKQLFGE